MTIYSGRFNDAATYDPTTRTAVSVRDGVLEYRGTEIGMEPADKVFTIYRSPATIANAAMRMAGIPITDEHVTLEAPAPTGGGSVSSAEMVDAQNADTFTTIAIRNVLAVKDTLLAMIDQGKRELSLGYTADLIPHSVHDFEQKDITPHHLAVVSAGRCGPMCSFIDKKGAETMKLHKAFLDAEGTMNLQQIVELSTALPEAIKAVPVDQLQKLLPALQQIVEAAKGVMPAEEPAPEAEADPVADADPAPEAEADPEEDPAQKFADALSVSVAAAVQAHTATIEKARQFLDTGYQFAGKSTLDLMRDAVSVESSEQFTDAELPLAFKMLRKTDSLYSEFADKQTAGLTTLQDKEL